VKRTTNWQRRRTPKTQIAVRVREDFEAARGATDHNLALAVDIGDPDIIDGVKALTRFIVATHEGDHRSGVGRRRLLHGGTPCGDERTSIFDGQNTGRY